MRSFFNLLLGLGLSLLSGCNQSDTASKEQSKAAEDAKAKAELISGVMDFLGAKVFFALVEDRSFDSAAADGDVAIQNEYDSIAYDEFEYDEKTGSLVFAETKRRFSDNHVRDGLRDAEYGVAISYLTITRIDLATCTSVVSLGSWTDNPILAKVTVVGDIQLKEYTKKREWSGRGHLRARNESLITVEDFEALRKEDFGEVSKGTRVDFVVTRSNAPRLKAMLGDLLKAHGITPPSRERLVAD